MPSGGDSDYFQILSNVIDEGMINTWGPSALDPANRDLARFKEQLMQEVAAGNVPELEQYAKRILEEQQSSSALRTCGRRSSAKRRTFPKPRFCSSFVAWGLRFLGKR